MRVPTITSFIDKVLKRQSTDPSTCEVVNKNIESVVGSASFAYTGQGFLENAKKLLLSQDEQYNDIKFRNPSSLYNQRAPEPWVTLVLALGIGLVAMVYWYINRWQPTRKQQLQREDQRWQLTARTLIATLSDNDDPLFTVMRLSAQALFFLAGFQRNFKVTLLLMLAYYAIVSCGDSLRILLAISQHDQLRELVLVSKHDMLVLNKTLKEHKKSKNCSIDLYTFNVYEDLSRHPIMVSMVFITQVLLISFVFIDLYTDERMTVFDGTSNVPVVSTLGSWCVYLLGIFMQCVYVLGPKRTYGSSEQDPEFWLQLLLGAKTTGASVQWYDAALDKTIIRRLEPSDIRVWLRFIMSFIVNGIGFKLLVHALPIQVAMQSALLGIVFRAVGMIYLVDLDNARGVTLTVKEGSRKHGSKHNLTPSSSTSSLLSEIDDDVVNSDGDKQDPVKSQVRELIEQARKEQEKIISELSSRLAHLEEKYDIKDTRSPLGISSVLGSNMKSKKPNPFELALVTNILSRSNSMDSKNDNKEESHLQKHENQDNHDDSTSIDDSGHVDGYGGNSTLREI